MNIEDQFELEHLLFKQRKCKVCGSYSSYLDKVDRMIKVNFTG